MTDLLADILADLEQLRIGHTHQRPDCYKVDDPDCSICDCGASEHNRRLDAVMERERQRIEQDRWRKFPGEFPGYCVRVEISVCDDPPIYIAWWNGGTWWLDGSHALDKRLTVTHWRPLPDAPESEE